MRELTPIIIEPEEHEVTHALDHIRRQSRLPPSELRLLSYVVEQALAGKGSEISQKTIAADVFARDLVHFDPKADSIVRTTTANLRSSLMAYYSREGQADHLLIELPKGSYVPRFTYRDQLSPAANSHLWSARVAAESRTTSGFRTAIAHLDRVLAEAPHLSLALALKAEALASSAAHGAPPLPALTECRALAEQALSAPFPAWQSWIAMGAVHVALDRNWQAAEQDFANALRLSDQEAATHAWYTAYLVARGRARTAVGHLRRAVNQYGYFNPTHLADLGMIEMLARDYDSAAITINGALEAAPGYYLHHINKATLLEAHGDNAGAIQVLDQAPARLMDRPVSWGLRALFAGRAGQTRVAKRRQLWLTAIRRAGQHVPSSQFAACALGLGDLKAAARHLRAGAEERDPLAIWFHAYPFFRHLDGEPEYLELIESLGLIRSSPKL
jgi:Tfp pilus assembly protein PilF